jgi:very-short-patch-repair endonuclease
MTIEVRSLVATKIGFASHQNAVPVLRELEVRSGTEEPLNDLVLELKSEPAFLTPRKWIIDRVLPESTVHVTDRDIQLNASLLSELVESVSGSVMLELKQGETILCSSVYDVELLARNQWGGSDTMADLLAAFVMPNDPAVDRVLKAASDVLRRSSRKDALDGYQGESRARVWELASAIWSAVCGFQLSYALPPASFEKTGQKVRTPSSVLDGRIGTCLDTALLFAAALEQAGLNPVIVVTKGHAFAGVWLQPVEFSALVTDEAAALRRRIDLKDLLVFETTLVTQANPASFSQAEKAAVRLLAADAPDPFEFAVDVRRARMQKIRPLAFLGAPGTSQVDPSAAPHVEALEEAPNLPGFDVEVTEESDAVRDRIGVWQRKLLNLTTSNRLLNLPESGKVVRLVCPEPVALEDRLAAGKRIRIVAMPDLAPGGRDEKVYEARTNESLREEVARNALERNEVVSSLEKEKLDAALVELYRKARSDMDEGGANTLFLALGFLRWKKSPADPRTYRAPLILLPVKLERKSALSGVVMTIHEDEPRFNLTLLELLRQDFELTIPTLEGPLPTDESGIDVSAVWTIVRRAVRDVPGFEVTQDLVLGTFSFAKYLMWKDLADRAERLKESRTVRHLIERTTEQYEGAGEIARPERLDDIVDPASLFTPLPADSSQLAAVIASAEGHDFVLDGPPGTGKSQTIANMIAHNLALGRRVLFVAEKMAALDVVQRRLAEKGLGPFCLELHSAKATKTEVLKQLDRAWTTRDNLSTEEWAREASEVRRLRDSLNEVIRLLHRKQANGLTLHWAIGRVVRDWSPSTPKLSFGALQHSEAEYLHLRDSARRLGLARAQVEDAPDALSGVARTDWSNNWQETVVAAAHKQPALLDELLAARDSFVSRSRIRVEADDLGGIARLLTLGETLLSLHGLDMRFAFAPHLQETVSAAEKALEALASYQAAEAALSCKYASEPTRRFDVAKVTFEWNVAGSKIWPLSLLAKGKVRKAIVAASGASGKIDPVRDLPLLTTMAESLSVLDAVGPKLVGVPGWAGLGSDAAQVKKACSLATMLRADISAAAEDADTLVALRQTASALALDGNDLLGPDGQFARDHRRLREAVTVYSEASKRLIELACLPGEASFTAMRRTAEAIMARASSLKAWTDWQRVRVEAQALGLGALVKALDDHAVAASDVTGVFGTAYAKWFASELIDGEPKLRQFSSAVHADDVETFRRLEDRLAELSVRYIRSKLCGAIPDRQEGAKRAGYTALSRELQKQRRHKPIRQLATEMGDAMTQLAPCMLMSPLSIAQYLPPDQAMFDLVIFDEASQIAPWDAIGAMARGKQVVIAGDPRQMPPTSFFTRSANATDGDADVEEDMESILDECLAAGIPMHSLSWHYRSRHESLIAFSNHRYYDGCLVTFPAPVTRASAVEWRRVEGVYAKGQGRTNQVEAQAMVNEAVRRLRDPQFNAAKKTLAIITLNTDQQRLVEDLLDRARRSYPEIEPHFAEDCTEPVVVKNLETVQGDERDVILLGIGFGPTEPGGRTMSMSFGALNSQGGWRRLNVAVTRARQEMLVFTSFDAGMIDLNRTSARAVRDLKHFIEFADRGPRALAEAVQGSVGGHDSPFEQAVAQELFRRGWQVVPQIGVSRFRIDLGIVHPDRSGDYLIGVECDGAAYHSAATARDRDKVRAAILKGLGWDLVRVWSTDWWVDKAGAAERLHRAIESALAASREARRGQEAAASSLVTLPIVHSEIRLPEAVISESANPDALTNACLPNRVQRSEVSSSQLMRSPEMPLQTQRPLRISIGARTMRAEYRVADLSRFSDVLDPLSFNERHYEATLTEIVEHILKQEAPISEVMLVQRVARAHGFLRAGHLIRERVMSIVRRRHHLEEDDETGFFVWLDPSAPDSWKEYRTPASAEDVRQIEEISLREISAAAVASSAEDKALDVARVFGVRRLSSSARARVELALAQMPQGRKECP